MGLLNPGGPIAQFKRNRCSISPVELILQSGVRNYLTRLDAYTFHEGFAHLLSYQATEIDCVDWHTPQLTEVAAASRAKLRLALTETDPDRQKQFLEEAVCGSYYEKFACMCGMLYLADRWETQGIDGLQSAFADYHGFAQRALSIRI